MTRADMTLSSIPFGSNPLPRVIFAVLLGMLVLASPPVQSLTLLTEENPPFNFTEAGKLTGIATEIVLETVRRAGLPVKVEVLSWDEAYKRAQAQRETCLFATARLENRERLFAWIGPLANNFWGVYGKPDFSIPIRTLDDLKAWRIGGVLSDAKVEYLRENAVTNIKVVTDDKLNPPRLMLPADNPNRIDLWITGLYASRDVARAAGVPNVKLVYVAREIPLYLACSPQTSVATLKSLSEAFEQVKAEGIPARVIAEYAKRFPR
jgi:polar amino acid transport system substrate-binding protein